MAELADLPIDCYTTGNHVWDKKEGIELLDREPRLLRPANYPEGNPGKGVYVGETAAGVPVAILNLEGRVFMSHLDSPFRVADRLLADLPRDVKVTMIDFHADATSEKQALAFHLTAASAPSSAPTPTSPPPTSASSPAAPPCSPTSA